METLLSAICWFGFGLFLFAFIGHGIWVVLAAIFRVVIGPEEPAGHSSARQT